MQAAETRGGRGNPAIWSLDLDGSVSTRRREFRNGSRKSETLLKTTIGIILGGIKRSVWEADQNTETIALNLNPKCGWQVADAKDG